MICDAEVVAFAARDKVGDPCSGESLETVAISAQKAILGRAGGEVGDRIQDCVGVFPEFLGVVVAPFVQV